MNEFNIINGNDQPNTGWLFGKGYFDEKDGKPILDRNKQILGAQIRNVNEGHTEGLQELFLKTTYPGLVMGTGYTHDAPNSEDGFKIGFSFDHTSGMPVIPGSSVKGAIRSAFPNEDKGDDKYRPEEESHRKDFILWVLSEVGIRADCDVKALGEEIFTGQGLSLYEQDIFFDAFPVRKEGSKFLDIDYITPHKDLNSKDRSMDRFVNPTPLKFLKVGPEVIFSFRFRLSQSIVCPDLTPCKKRLFFGHILTTFGIGAKTNVGYGQLESLEKV